VVNESGNGLTNQRATVGMARSSEPHSSDSQFYVNLYDNEALDPNKTRWGYAVFGKVVQGMEVVDKIGNVATGSRGPFKEDAPLQPVVIERIERLAAP
jgi:cyclophilin family peptidyl-prolyl cis-trans isomerase